MSAPTRSRRTRKQRQAVPFYAPSQQTQEQVSQRVLNSVHASVRAVSTKRPFTPADTSRGLFGASSIHAQSDASLANGLSSSPSASTQQLVSSSSRGVPDPRPPSAFPIGRRQFLESLPESDDLARPKMGKVRLQPLPPSASGTRPRTSSASRRRQAARVAENKDSMPQDPRDTNREPSGIASEPTSKDASVRRKLPDRAQSAVAAVSTLPQPPETPPSARRTSPKRKARQALSATEGSRDKGRPNSKSPDDADTNWPMIEPILAELDPSKDPVALVASLLQLQRELAATPLESGQNNSHVLRAVVRLLDISHTPVLLLSAKTILQLVRGGETATNVARLLFKISRDEKNDPLFIEHDMLGDIAHVLDKPSLARIEALIYACGAVKNLTNEHTSRKASAGRVRSASSRTYDPKQTRRVLVDLGVPDSLTSLLALLAAQPQDGTSKNASAAAVQATAALRNFTADSDLSAQIASKRLFETLDALLYTFAADADVVLNVARVLSKLTADDEATSADAPATLVPNLVKALRTFRNDESLCVRTLFVLGNLTTDDERRRIAAFESTQSAQELLSWLPELCTDLLDCQAEVRALGTDSAAKAKRKELATRADLVTKLARVIANLAISPELGPEIAKSSALESMLPVLSDASTSEQLDLLLNVVGAINNIYYHSTDTDPLVLLRAELTDSLQPLMLSDNLEVVAEAARVLGNLTRSPDIRHLVVEKRLDELLLLLVAHPNQEVSFPVCGVLINVTAEPELRNVVEKQDGLEQLFEALEASIEVDWELAGMVCMILSNCTDPSSPRPVALEQDYAGDLLELLRSALSVEDPSSDSARCFVPAATQLLRHVQAALNPLEALSPDDS